MEKKGVQLFKAAFLVIAILIVSVAFFIRLYPVSSGLSGLSVVDFKDNLSSIPKPAIILAGAWIFFIIFFLIVFIRDRVLSKREMKRLNVSKRGGKYKTRLDILYEILKENKKIKIKIIAKAFEVSNDKAMEWCKILESGHLASIEYPGFMGDPEIRLIGSPMKDKEMKK